MRTWIVVLCAAGGGFVAGLTVATLTQTLAAKAALANRAALEADLAGALAELRSAEEAKGKVDERVASLLEHVSRLERPVGQTFLDLAKPMIPAQYGDGWRDAPHRALKEFWYEGRLWRFDHVEEDEGLEIDVFMSGDPSSRVVFWKLGPESCIRVRQQRFSPHGDWVSHGERVEWWPTKTLIFNYTMDELLGHSIVLDREGRLLQENIVIGPTQPYGMRHFEAGRRVGEEWLQTGDESSQLVGRSKWDQRGKLVEREGSSPFGGWIDE